MHCKGRDKSNIAKIRIEYYKTKGDVKTKTKSCIKFDDKNRIGGKKTWEEKKNRENSIVGKANGEDKKTGGGMKKKRVNVRDK